jgi:hypothetical protein
MFTRVPTYITLVRDVCRSSTHSKQTKKLADIFYITTQSATINQRGHTNRIYILRHNVY